MPQEWRPEETIRQHDTWDDRLTQEARGGRIAEMLRRLRSCGAWEVHAVHHARHQDIIAIPGQRSSERCERDAALAVVRHLARVLGLPSRLVRPMAPRRAAAAREAGESDERARRDGGAPLYYHVLIAHGFLVAAPTFEFHTLESRVEACHMLDDHLPRSRAVVVSPLSKPARRVTAM